MEVSLGKPWDVNAGGQGVRDDEGGKPPPMNMLERQLTRHSHFEHVMLVCFVGSGQPRYALSSKLNRDKMCLCEHPSVSRIM